MNSHKVIMCDQYVRIAEESDGEAIEIPTEQDGTIILSSVSGMYFIVFVLMV